MFPNRYRDIHNAAITPGMCRFDTAIRVFRYLPIEPEFRFIPYALIRHIIETTKAILLRSPNGTCFVHLVCDVCIGYYTYVVMSKNNSIIDPELKMAKNVCKNCDLHLNILCKILKMRK